MNKKPTSIKSAEPEAIIPNPPISFSGVDPQNPEPDVYPNEVLKNQSGEIISGSTEVPTEAARIATLPDEWKERNKIMVEARVPFAEETVNASDLISRPTDVPIVEFSALREPSLHYSVGLPVLFGGEYAAIITKVWDSGLVNLIVFSAEHPVSDIKTRVSYGEGSNTWKEIN